ncbi:hypothetical protein FRAAL0311 [Frankia alni ACN14a]|uniref:Uncharacterized protein n=1 Tax=Frankia alni (strain DSM 45986 / CECT 9034 / ACN14a) TaxID=326424 RepID=Q0RTW0_FRAAA|nr:hypothetical protein FRAAL0311 [Frankia alni ACN14a]
MRWIGPVGPTYLALHIRGRIVTAVDGGGFGDTDLDQHSAGFREHNYEVMADLRNRCPVARSSTWGGYWLVTSYEAVFDA